jgi:hypothetical protein
MSTATEFIRLILLYRTMTIRLSTNTHTHTHTRFLLHKTLQRVWCSDTDVMMA